MESIEKAGFKPGEDVALGLDCAATEFFKDGNYVYEGERKTRDPKAQAKYLAKLASDYPIISIEDGLAEDDWEGWKYLTDLIGKKTQLVGDDLFVTNTARLRDGIRMSVTLSTDHRAVDGALGAELLGAFKRMIENPMGMLV